MKGIRDTSSDNRLKTAARNGNSGNFVCRCVFPVSGYVRPMALGAREFYSYCHDFIVFHDVPIVFTLLSYFVDHHRQL
jgi:hypothetical protein